ncbi:carboxylesterase family protein [Paeniglutamicibacter terrestris]|uniref:Carboxylesterase family protein n=1 Tax=Paeniglutamicibacter terrestris TaxID=2723403 RepID=A0ABX1G0W4_9MICC|nr:carboxylesterase family protein [Paeniglutamicibacter terrestris]
MKTFSYGTLAAGRYSALQPVDSLIVAEPAAFPQSPGALDWLLGGALGELEQSEQAFQLSVFAPEDATNLPVMVFLPGGAFVSGAGAVRWYDATHFAQQQNCVVVVVNYRIGLLAHGGEVGAGNLVPRDLLHALQWVQTHIATLGGNPADVSLVGQSAGAFWAFVMAQLPAARGLFQRVALMSLTYQPPLDQDAAAQRQSIIDLALAGKSAALVPIAELLAAQGEVARAWAGRGLGLMPSIDENVPADLFDVDAAMTRLHVEQILLTHTKDEAQAFIGQAPEMAFTEGAVAGFMGAHFEDPEASGEKLRQELPGSTPKTRMARAMTLHQIELYATEFADAAVAAGKNVSTVRFDVESLLSNAGAAHCFELPFLFGNRQQWSDAPMLAGLSQSIFDAAAAELGAVLGGFVRTGVPVTAAGEMIPAFSPQSASLQVISEDGTDLREPERDLVARRSAPARA